MSNEYYIWDTELQAQAALDFINATEWFPIVGRNAKTGELQPNKQKTTKWANNVSQRSDNKWCFQRIPESTLDFLNIPQEQREAFLTGFNPSIELYQADWFPAPDMPPE